MKSRFTQISFFSVLLCGRYNGVASVGEVKKLGNIAIATMDMLDGEMLMVDGVVYQARSDGRVYLPEDRETVPFGTIAEFTAETALPLGEIASFEEFEKLADREFPDRNTPLAVRVRGRFPLMKVRTVARTENGRGLAEAADDETKFELVDSEGDLVGFRLPGYMNGINAPGWHLHYVDAAREHGGHVVNFSVAEARLEACACGEFQIRYPDDPAVFMGLDLSRDRTAELRKAEAER